MFIKARLIYEVHDHATVVPASALVRRNEQEGVFLIDNENKKANFIAVKTGFAEGDSVEIVSPPITGDVAILGHHLLEDGMSVILTNKDELAKESLVKDKNPGKNKATNVKKGGQQQ